MSSKAPEPVDKARYSRTTIVDGRATGGIAGDQKGRTALRQNSSNVPSPPAPPAPPVAAAPAAKSPPTPPSDR